MENKKNNVITVDPSFSDQVYDEITQYFADKTKEPFRIQYPTDESIVEREDYDYIAQLIAPDIAVIRDDWLAHLVTEWQPYGSMRLAYVLRNAKAVVQSILIENIKELRHKGDYSTLTILAEYVTELDIPFDMYHKINRMIFDAEQYEDDLSYDKDSPSFGEYYGRIKEYFNRLISKTVEAQWQHEESTSSSSRKEGNDEIVVTEEYLRQKAVLAVNNELYAFEVYQRIMQVYGYITCYADAADSFFASVARRLRADRDAGQISGLLEQFNALIRTYDAYCHYSDVLMWDEDKSHSHA